MISMFVLQALMIQAWVRTGFWVASAALKHLHVTLALEEVMLNLLAVPLKSKYFTHCLIDGL